MKNQELVNAIGTELRAAENALVVGNPGAARRHLATLHKLLGRAFNRVRDAVPLDWDEAAGNGEVTTQGGGTPTKPPEPDE